MASAHTVMLVSLVLCTVASAGRLPTFAKQLAFKLPADVNPGDLGDLSAKDAAFSQCCIEKGVFAGLDGVDEKATVGQLCNYAHALDRTNLTSMSPPDNLNQRISDFVKCGTDSQDDTECCQAAGLQDDCATLCDFTPSTIDMSQFGVKINQCVGSDVDGKALAACIIENAYNDNDGQ